MMPLLVVFQIPAAHLSIVLILSASSLAVWGSRVLIIFALALVPLTGTFLEARNQLAVIIVRLFGFNLARGISSCAWLPWIDGFVPATLRGQYLTRDAALTNLGCFFTLVPEAACLAGDPQPWQFALLFAFSRSWAPRASSS